MAVNKGTGLILSLWSPVILCMGFIFYTSGVSGRNIPSIFPFQDTVFHAFVYSVLSFFFCRALTGTCPGWHIPTIIFLSVIFGVFYGMTDEFHQAFVPERTVSGMDLFIDGVGSLLGGLGYWARKKVVP